MYLRERTYENFVRGICEKSSVDSTRVTELVFLDTEGIINRTNDEVLRRLFNEQPLHIEFVPVHADSMITSSPATELKLRVHL